MDIRHEDRIPFVVAALTALWASEPQSSLMELMIRVIHQGHRYKPQKTALRFINDDELMKLMREYNRQREGNK